MCSYETAERVTLPYKELAGLPAHLRGKICSMFYSMWFILLFIFI
jgi:hypothetical protein